MSKVVKNPKAEVAAKKVYAVNKADLALAVGICRQTLTRLLARHGAPKARADNRWDIEAVREWIASCKGTGSEGRTEQEKMRDRKLAAETEKAEIELKKAAEEYGPWKVFQAGVDHLVVMIRQEVVKSGASEPVKKKLLEKLTSFNFREFAKEVELAE